MRKKYPPSPQSVPRAPLAELVARNIPLRIIEAAELLGVNRCTIDRLIKSGSLPAIRVGHQHRVMPSDLLRPLAPPAAKEAA